MAIPWYRFLNERVTFSVAFVCDSEPEPESELDSDRRDSESVTVLTRRVFQTLAAAFELCQWRVTGHRRRVSCSNTAG